MKIKSVFSSLYLPPIYFYSCILSEKEVLFDVNEYFIKQTYRNRCSILGANGVQELIVPVKNRNSKILMNNVELSNAENWQKNHWKSIESAYRKSPFFEYYADDLLPFYSTNRNENLVELNTGLFNKINKLLNLNIEVNFSEEYINSDLVKLDFRSLISPKNKPLEFNQKEYIQVFSDKLGFKSNLSIVDLLFNEGPNSFNYLKNHL